MVVTGLSGLGDYYITGVALGIEEYYRGIGEAPGAWFGVGAAQLGIFGVVGGEELNSLLEGLHPKTGEPLGVFTKRSVLAFDLTFTAPKSVSLLMGLGEPDVVAATIAAHEAAVDAAMTWVQDEVARTRTGPGGVNQASVNGITAAEFRHRTSRAGDPHLHTHVLVANAVEGPDGRWRTLDSKMLYTYARAGGFLYQAHLRHELTARLGVEWLPVVKGLADISGIDREVLVGFSDRRRQILEHIDKVGFRSARAAELAALGTRSKKDSVSDVTMRDVWAAKADTIGFDPATITDVLHQATPHLRTTDEIEALFDWLAGPDGLTAQASTFDRRDVLRAIAEHLPGGGTVEEIIELADRFADHRGLVRILDSVAQVGLTRSDAIRVDGKIIPAVSAARWSTRELVDLEQRIVSEALSRQHEGAGVVPDDVLDSVLANHDLLTDEQTFMVARLVTDGHGVQVVAAAAGTGKTFTLDAARAAWEAAGYRVIGAAHTGQAARELRSSAGIHADTLAMTTIDLGRGRLRLDNRTVVLVDLCRVSDYAGFGGLCLVSVGVVAGFAGIIRGLRGRRGVCRVGGSGPVLCGVGWSGLWRVL